MVSQHAPRGARAGTGYLRGAGLGCPERPGFHGVEQRPDDRFFMAIIAVFTLIKLGIEWHCRVRPSPQ